MDDKRGMEFLLEVARGLTAATSMESVWQFIVSNVHDIIQASSSSLYLAAGSDLKLQARKSEAPEKSIETREREIAAQARGVIEPFVLITDLESRTVLEAQIQVFTLVIPICVDKVTAGIYIIERTGQSFLQSEIDFVDLAASLAAVTLHENQMLQSEREQREFAEALRDSAEALTSTLSLDEVLDRILRDLRMVVYHDAAHVMLIEKGIAHVVRSSGYAEIGFEEMLLSRKFPIDEIPHLQALAERRKPITISNTRDSAEWTNLPEVSWIRSYAGAPIRIKEKTVGFLVTNQMHRLIFRHVYLISD